MTIPNDTIRDYDELAAALGTTPKYNRAGEIIPIGRPEGQSAGTYAVYIGRGIGFYNNWGLCNAMTAGFPGACHKKYRSLEEARMAWEQGPVELRGKWRVPAPRPPLRTPGFEVDKEQMYVPAPPPPRREVEVSPPSPLPLPASVSALPGAMDSLDEEERMWQEAAWPDDAAHSDDDAQAPSISLSRTISSVSSLSLSSTPALTAGTISPRLIATPALPVAAFPPQATPKITTRTLSCPIVDKSQSVRPIRRRHDSNATATPPASPTKHSVGASRPLSTSPTKKLPQPANASASSSRQAHTRTPRYTLERDVVAVPKPKEMFVVVRGDRPGIYFDRNTAFVKLGVNPGMKLVVFSLLSKASWYFVQCYMAGKVGVPVVVVPDSDAE
ncbi:hypothetical protein K466DRAFT_604429 [Polyporus arcularius HHB13444]|uniref:Ribonuclease H1 N-terminal domain-containing protein n=1 Tax=Polyporus arcularius HHB13444 TaxID=1314778 RepID=A0A5C3NXN7_9APHY|nr:hypothetical protein K466DRAFT_604429 [Polyporus arcularius HHB13444]